MALSLRSRTVLAWVLATLCLVSGGAFHELLHDAGLEPDTFVGSGHVELHAGGCDHQPDGDHESHAGCRTCASARLGVALERHDVGAPDLQPAARLAARDGGGRRSPCLAWDALGARAPPPRA